jgi:hypothetical protein
MSGEYFVKCANVRYPQSGYQGTPIARSISDVDKEHGILPSFEFTEESKIS